MRRKAHAEKMAVIEQERKKRLSNIQTKALNESLALLNELTGADCLDLPNKFDKLKQFLINQLSGEAGFSQSEFNVTHDWPHVQVIQSCFNMFLTNNLSRLYNYRALDHFGGTLKLIDGHPNLVQTIFHNKGEMYVKTLSDQVENKKSSILAKQIDNKKKSKTRKVWQK